jgi:hypothetical protein
MQGSTASLRTLNEERIVQARGQAAEILRNAQDILLANKASLKVSGGREWQERWQG